MKYVYGKKLKTFKDRLVSGVAALALLASNSAIALPMLFSTHVNAAGMSVVTTDINTWNLSNTRSKGHNAIVPTGLRVWTEDASSLSKAAGYYDSADFDLEDAADFTLDWTYATPPATPLHQQPGGQLVVDLNNNGIVDGILVVENLYGGIGGKLWLAETGLTTADGINLATVPHETPAAGSGNYPNQGSLSSWVAAFPNAKVLRIGYSLGSGVKGDGVINKITVNDTDYTFAIPAPTAAPTEPALAGDVIYDSTPAPFPSNLPSLGYTATSTYELGDKVSFAGSSRDLKNVAVTLSSWACQTGSWNKGDCATTPGSTFNHPVTLNIYEVAGDGTVGDQIDSITQTFAIPYRPTVDPTCAGGNAWRDSNGGCFNGYHHVVVFDATGITVPNEVIFGVAYNTSNYGANPVGSVGPYDSLNVSLTTEAAATGTNLDLDEVFWSSTYSGRALGLSPDSGWASTGSPAVIFTATTPDTTAPTFEIVNPTNNSSVSGTVTIKAKVTDPSGITKLLMNVAGQSHSWNNGASSTITKAGDIFSITLDTTTLPDGPIHVVLRGTDGAGNTRYWNNNANNRQHVFYVDNSAPNAPNNLRLQIRSTGNFVGNNGWTNRSDVTALWNSNNTEAVTYEYQYWNDVTSSPYNSGNRWANAVNSEQYAGTVNQGDGKHYFCVVAIDAAGNRSTCSTPFAFNYDGTEPVTDINVSPVVNGIFTVNGDASDNLALNRVYVQLVSRVSNTRCGGTTINLIPEGSDAEWSRTYDITTLGCPEGDYAAHVAVVDRAGNTSSAGWTDNFTVTAPEVLPAAITQPSVDGEGFGFPSTVTLEAHDYGAENGGVEWAVRAGTCAAQTNTVFGNVDGFNTPYTWTGGEFNSSVSGLLPGDYCFVFNPAEGERYTRTFLVDNPLGICTGENCPDNEPDKDDEVVNEVIDRGQGGQVLGDSTGVLAETGTQNSGLIILAAGGLVLISLVTLRRKQKD